jgi:uncharacterized protein (TIGR01777 family)
MRVFITGGTGFVGRALVRELLGAGHEVSVLTRRAKQGAEAGGGPIYLDGDPTVPGRWQESLSGHDAVVNLAGAPIFRRWTPAYKQMILKSRIDTTANIVDALAGSGGRKVSLLNASAVGYYGFRQDELLDENAPSGTDFLARVAEEWEASAMRASGPDTRVVLCRFGIVLGAGGGALMEMVSSFRRYPPAVLGSGRQWFSWIHIGDLARAIAFVLEDAQIAGPVNCTAPGPVRNHELTAAVAARLGRRVFPFKVPGFMIRLAMGEFGRTLLEGQRVHPARLIESGFKFEYPDLDAALAEAMGSEAMGSGE